MLCLGTDYDIYTEFQVPRTKGVHVEGVRGAAPTAEPSESGRGSARGRSPLVRAAASAIGGV